MNITSPIARRIAAGITLTGLGVLSIAAAIVPGGALQSRAVALRTDEPTTSTTVAPAPAEPPVELPAAVPVVEETTTTTAPAAVPVTPPPPVKAAVKPVAVVPASNVSGHYVCFNMDATTQYAPGPDCKADVTADPGPNNSSPNADPALPNGADGDQPGQTLGSTDDAYGADLTAKSCSIKPWLCGDGWTR